MEDNSQEQEAQTGGEQKASEPTETPKVVEASETVETVEATAEATTSIQEPEPVPVTEEAPPLAQETQPLESEEVKESKDNPEISQEESSELRSVVESTEPTEEKLVQKTMTSEEKESIIAELKSSQEEGKSIDVLVTAKARGGLRVDFKKVSLFLPISHFSLTKLKDDSELDQTIGTTLSVNVHDIKIEPTHSSVIVTRKKILANQIWSKFELGQKVEGTVTSIPSFGVFLDIGGIEGLVHVSRLSKSRVENTSDFCKKGDKLEVKIISLDKENNKIGLSRKELEPSPWIGASDLYPAGSVQKAKIKRFLDFGTFVELKAGVEGLLHNSEISWTKRISHPSQKLKIAQMIDVKIISIDESKGTASLSIKRVGENPWKDMAARFTLNSVYFAEVMEISSKGLIFALNEDVDAFMPRSKLRSISKDGKMPYAVGDKVEIMVSEVDAERESMIVSPKVDKAVAEKFAEEKKQVVKFKKSKDDDSFSLGDLLNKSSLESLAQIKN